MREISKTPRKEAQQARAKRTVDAILNAATQVLKTYGPSGFTTNHVAREANRSVGSIYQYFPNKQAILFRLMTLQVTNANAQKPAALVPGSSVSLEERIRASVGWHLDTQRHDPVLFQRMYEVQQQVLTAQERRQFDRYHEEAVHTGLLNHKSDVRIPNLRTAALVVSQFLLAATQSAAAEPQLLTDDEYECQIADAVLAYLR